MGNNESNPKKDGKKIEKMVKVDPYDPGEPTFDPKYPKKKTGKK